MKNQSKTGESVRTIRDYRTGDILYEGAFETLRACAEQAVRDGVQLDFADLSRANLGGANLDEAQMRHARLSGANLSGVNLSESWLDGTDFTGAVMQGACFCYSAMRRCTFTDGFFGATDIAGADISHSVFSTLSAFTLNFREARQLDGCLFAAESGRTHYPFSRAPVVVNGLPWPVIVMDYHIRVGNMTGTFAEILRCASGHSVPALTGDNGLQAFAASIGSLLRELVIAARPGSHNRHGAILNAALTGG